MMLKFRPVLVQFKLFDGFIDKNDAVRIAHRYGRDLKRAPQHRNRRFFHQPMPQQAGYALAFQNGFAHVHADALRHAVPNRQVKRFDSGIGLQLDDGLLRHPSVIDIFGDTSRRVSAHRSA